MKILTRNGSILIILIIVSLNCSAQVLPVGTPLLEDYYRREQLLGNLDSTISFNIRPLTNAALRQQNLFDPSQQQPRQNSIYRSADSSAMLQLMPIEWKNQAVTGYPYGWNDGPMIPAVGYQTYFSAGISARYKFLSIQLRPEFIYASNNDFDGYQGRNRSDWASWWRYGNDIDAPVRFGETAYSRIFPGQSSIRFNFSAISIGVSTENLWWGPGRRNSLMMSNSAPGFLHATINTTRPLETGIGFFEVQLVGGRLEQSGFTPKVLTDDDYHQEYYRPKPRDWRYFSGFVVSYQPKWVPGLSLGIINTFTVNSRDMGNKLGDFIPFFPSGSSSEMIDRDDPRFVSDMAAQDRNMSLFARWVVPGAQFEIYGEYARNDHGWNVRDIIVLPNHSRSYLFGLRKLVALPSTQKDMLQISAEVTHQEPSRSVTLRSTGTIYGHYIVRDGYTHLGQLFGAGVGRGNNVQSLDISWVRGLKQLGFQVERLVYNRDLLFHTSRDPRASWVDLGIGFLGRWDYKNFLFSGDMNFISARNYQYRIEERPELGNYWRFDKQDKRNFFLQISTSYRF